MIPIVIFPSVLTSASGNGAARMSDIMFMSKKTHGGKARQIAGSVNTITDVCSITANAGKDMYLAKAKVNGRSTSLGGPESVTVVLKLNNIIVEIFSASLAGGSTAEGEFSFEYEFCSLGEKVLASEIIKLEVIAISSSSVTVNGKIEVFEETTGADPSI